MMAFIAHTEPLANIPSKNQLVYGIIVNSNVGEKNVNENRNPTQVEVHIMHCIRSPKKVDFFIKNSLRLSKMLPNTSMFDIP